MRPSAVSPRRNTNQTAPKAKIASPVPRLASNGDGAGSTFRSTGVFKAICSRLFAVMAQCEMRQPPRCSRRRGAKLGPAATRKAAFCVAPRPAQGGSACGAECAAYFAGLLCNAGLITSSSPARILLRGLWLDETDRRPGFKGGLRPTRTLLPTPRVRRTIIIL
jgi:hypothetical protein